MQHFLLYFLFLAALIQNGKSGQSDWNFMVNACNLNSGTIEITSCDTRLAEEDTNKASNFIAGYEYIGPQEFMVQMSVNPNHPYYNQIDVAKITRANKAPVTYIKGVDPNTLSIVIHTNGCNFTTNYRLTKPRKAYSQDISAIGSYCSEDQKFMVSEGLKSGPKLESFTRN